MSSSRHCQVQNQSVGRAVTEAHRRMKDSSSESPSRERRSVEDSWCASFDAQGGRSSSVEFTGRSAPFNAAMTTSSTSEGRVSRKPNLSKGTQRSDAVAVTRRSPGRSSQYPVKGRSHRSGGMKCSGTVWESKGSEGEIISIR